MKTVYTMAGIEDIDGDDELELTAVDARMNDGDAINAVADDASIVSDDDLSEGDIVYYAVIDATLRLTWLTWSPLRSTASTATP